MSKPCMLQEQKEKIKRQLQNLNQQLYNLADELHENPETAWQEHQSSEKVANFLTGKGFRVEHPYLGFDTALRAVYPLPKGVRPRYRIGFFAEYDALPQLGHACGHNLISGMSLGGACAIANIAAEHGFVVEVYGTPAEEGGGGKIELLDAGAFRELDFALMAHPAPVDVARARPYAVAHWHISYTGQAAHAAAYPDRGVNANDAFLVAQLALGLLRQQLPAGVRVHGVQTRGGEAPNAIPERTEGRWYVRADSMELLLQTEEKVTRCFEAGALATGATLKITSESKRYSEMRTDEEALQIYENFAEQIGRKFSADPASCSMARASTDMGNVSQIVPAIHPYIGLGCTASNHQAEFAAACTGENARKTLTDGALALALTAFEVALRRSSNK